MHPAIFQRRVNHRISQCTQVLEAVQQIVDEATLETRPKTVAVVTPISFELASALILLAKLRSSGQADVNENAVWQAAQMRMASARHALFVAQDDGDLPYSFRSSALSI